MYPEGVRRSRATHRRLVCGSSGQGDYDPGK
jgi:hypothetical protein